jgi:hypothetical protein
MGMKGFRYIDIIDNDKSAGSIGALRFFIYRLGKRDVNAENKKRGGKKMKKIFLMALALAMAASFTTKAIAGSQTVGLGLHVEFTDVQRDRVLAIQEELETVIGPACQELHADGMAAQTPDLVIQAITGTPDSAGLAWYKNVVIPGRKSELKSILDDRQDLADLIQGVLEAADGISGEIYQFIEELIVRAVGMWGEEIEEISGICRQIFENARGSEDPAVIEAAVVQLNDARARLSVINGQLNERLTVHSEEYPHLVELIQDAISKGAYEKRLAALYIEALLNRLTIWAERAQWSSQDQPFDVRVGQELRLNVFAEDKNATSMDFDLDLETLPEGADWIEMGDNSPTKRGYGIIWTPAEGQVREDPYVIRFEAHSVTVHNRPDGSIMIIDEEYKEFLVEIRVLDAMISIRLVDENGELVDSWGVGVVEPGGVKPNTFGPGVCMHYVENTGGSGVIFDIGYGPAVLPDPYISPALRARRISARQNHSI